MMVLSMADPSGSTSAQERNRSSWASFSCSWYHLCSTYLAIWRTNPSYAVSCFRL